jgi:hypothetical protein
MQGAGVADKPFHILNIRFVGLGDTVWGFHSITTPFLLDS